MKIVKCEICGNEIKSGPGSYFSMFGQKACSTDCMEKLAEIQNKEITKKLNAGIKK